MLTFSRLEINVANRQLFAIDDLQLSEGLVALVGRNGAGKSTFLKTIVGMHTDFTGQLKLQGKSLTEIPKGELAKEIAIVYSKSTIFGNHSGRDVMMLGRLPYQNAFAKVTQQDQDKIEEIIEQLALQAFVEQEFSKMSDGEKQLIMIGRALAQDTKIILLDEPGAFLDLVNRHKLIQVLLNIGRNMNKLILFSTHEIDFLEQVCSGVLLIEQNKMRFLENKETFLSEISQSFGIDKLGRYEV